uniref:Uncharacterized protein n=1 Tax=Anguilla anguilla TaxID=7936 RepID=A0A0E9U4J6_ANGAN
MNKSLVRHQSLGSTHSESFAKLDNRPSLIFFFLIPSF